MSLKLDIISLECLQWVLKSLRLDEMMPSEKAILSRIKEAFAFKVQNEIWIDVVRKLKGEEKRRLDQTTLNKYDWSIHTKERDRYEFFDGGENLVDTFQIVELQEELGSQVTNAVFFRGQQQWLCIDSQTRQAQFRESDYQVDPLTYRTLKLFLFDYFKFCQENKGKTGGNDDSEDFWCSSIQNALTK